MARKKWTEQEDDRVIEALSEDSSNLRKVFRILAEELDRTPSAVELRWYMVLNNPEHPKYRGTACFMTISKNSRSVNKKIADNNSTLHHNNSLWHRILKMMKLI